MEFHETYHLLIKDKDFPGIQVVKKVEFETQENPTGVDFDYKKVMEYEDNPDFEVLGFYHTHPPLQVFMSYTDVETMKAWVKCLGRSLFCLIGTKQITGRNGDNECVWRDIVLGWKCFKKGALPVNIRPVILYEDEYKVQTERYVKLNSSRYFIEC